jgi:hypothetical protein
MRRIPPTQCDPRVDLALVESFPASDPPAFAVASVAGSPSKTRRKPPPERTALFRLPPLGGEPPEPTPGMADYVQARRGSGSPSKHTRLKGA